jgi:hypothetical protein
MQTPGIGGSWRKVSVYGRLLLGSVVIAVLISHQVIGGVPVLVDVLGIHVHSGCQVLGGDELLLVDEEVYQGHLGGGGTRQDVAYVMASWR